MSEKFMCTTPQLLFGVGIRYLQFLLISNRINNHPSKKKIELITLENCN